MRRTAQRSAMRTLRGFWLAPRLKILVPRLPQHERGLAGEVVERDDLLLGEVAIVVIDFHEGRSSAAASSRVLKCSDELPRLPRHHARVIPSADAHDGRIRHALAN